MSPGLKDLSTLTLMKMAVGVRLKELFMPKLSGGGWGSWIVGNPRTSYNYAADLGDGLSCSVVMPVVQWMARAFPEAPVIVEQREGDEWVLVPDHPLADLLSQPNPFYAGAQLWMTTVIDWCWFGESYWRIMSSVGGQPAELWWLPPWSIEPKWPEDGSVFISHYAYGPNQVRLPVEEVVHFRHGLDPRNSRHGLPPLRAILQDIWIDTESNNFVGAMLRNMGIPGLIISPKTDAGSLGAAEVERVKQYISSRFTGDARGQPLALGAPADVQKLSLSPTELDMTALRDTAEQRVSAALGIPAAIVGLGAGLDVTKVGAPQPISAQLWTPHGPTTMGGVVPGDIIAIPHGWGRVEAVYPQGVQDIYRITFQDGSMAESTLNHLWEVHTPRQGWRSVPLAEIVSWPDGKLRRATVPLQGVTDFDEQPVLIPPYVLGLLLADGSFRENLFFSNMNREIVETIRDQVGQAYAVNQTSVGGHDYRITYRSSARGRGIGGGTGGLNPFVQELRRLGLWMLYSHEKFIPDLYKYNSVQVRRQILQGILDGDGYVNLHGQPALEQTSIRLANDVTEIVQSLGGYTLSRLKRADRRTRMIKGHAMASRFDRTHLSIVIDDAASLFCCADKRDRCRPRTKAPSRKFRSITFVRQEEAQCIAVEGGLYLTNDFIVTHNTMSEMRKLAWQNGIIPVQRIMAAELGRILLPWYETRPERFRVAWDYDQVEALQESRDDLAKRYQILVSTGIVMVSEAREALGYESTKDDQIYLRPSSLTPTDPKDQMPEPEPTPPALLPPGNRPALPANGNGNGTGAVQQRAAQLNQGSLEELVNSIIGRHAQRMEEPPPALVRLASKLQQREESHYPMFESMVLPILERFGDVVGVIAQEVLGRKASAQDTLDAVVITERLPFVQLTAELAETYAKISETMARMTVEFLNDAFDLEQVDPVRVINHITPLMRERTALLDMDVQARHSILRILEEAREHGLSEDAMIDLIKHKIPAGRWSTPEIRAQVLVRTEARYATNLAATAYARESGIEQVLVLDSRMGSFDPACDERNGWVISPQEARALAGVEHPNGTLALLPLPRRVPTVEPPAVTLDAVMKAGRRLDAAWQKKLGPDYVELVAERTRLEKLKKDLRDQFDRAQRLAERSDIFGQQQQVSRELRSVKDTIQGLHRPTLHDALSEIRPLGQVEARWTPGTNDAVRRAIADVSDSLPRAWLERSRAGSIMDGQLTDRGYYWAAKKEMRLSGTGADRVSNAFHEFGHRFEEVVPKIFEMEDEFYKQRTARDIPKNRLQKLGPGYRDDEVTRPDRFVVPYMGKAYNHRNYELLSMGLESVFTGSYDLSKDPEFRRFILGILATL